MFLFVKEIHSYDLKKTNWQLEKKLVSSLANFYVDDDDENPTTSLHSMTTVITFPNPKIHLDSKLNSMMRNNNRIESLPPFYFGYICSNDIVNE
ncbi:hypothetical protein DERP_001870 [Dermatophagoides pteronyssinus]|uniref:Uncharacterized protein n=1 Tax=Dermatophagoides pteronyssinus TaxID=6956 RepID=A0ABQ8JBQ2_DERPT|nr:hypothetical protein DERP_001870 [Dermatophagoides pteronyssinus]